VVLDSLEVEVEADDTYVVTAPFALCATTERVVSVDCHLDYTQKGQAWFYEFSFEITVTDMVEPARTFSTQDREIAKAYIPEESRPLVLDLVVAALDALLKRAKPLVIYRVTKNRNPTPKSLRKHDIMTSFLESKGYRVSEEGTDDWGRRLWVCAEVDFSDPLWAYND